MAGYDMIPHPNIEKNTGRGSILYIKSSLIHKEIKLPKNCDDFEECIIQEIKLNQNDSLICANVYRRGESSKSNNEKLLKIIEEVTGFKDPLILFMGDFNLKDISWLNVMAPGNNQDDYNHKFIECIRNSFLFQHIIENTRQRGDDSPSCLDLLFTNEENMIKNIDYLAPLGKSDHSIIKFEIPCKVEKPVPKIKVVYEQGDYAGLKQALDKVDWKQELGKHSGDVNKQWEFFKNKFATEEKRFVPRKKVFINGTLNSKLSTPLDKKSLRVAKKKNHKWSRIRKNLADDEEKLQYNRIRNQIRSLTRKSTKILEKNITQNVKKNPKGFWKYSQQKLKTRSNIPDLIKPGTEQDPVYATTDQEKAEVLLKYFSSVFTTEPDGDTMPDFDEREYEEILENININYDVVLEKLKKLKTNKSPGPDKIHPRVLKEISTSIAEAISIIFNTSLQTKSLPNDWRHANVSAIYKKGQKTLPNNYRPVSLTCIICKVMESIIRDNVIKHMKDNNLFSPKQFGFIEGRSTVLQLLHVLHIWCDILDQGGVLDAIYCDFMKAFDKVPHRRLIYKISKYGIKGNVLGWIESFLNNRTQCVVHNDFVSKSDPVTSGIPQGSVLGPILFVLYINDLPEVIDKDSFAFLFADDTKVFRTLQHLFNDPKILQGDIVKLVEWSKKWLLKFHPDKCVKIGIGLNRNAGMYPYRMDGHTLEESMCEKDIGVHIDSNLKFDIHISKAIGKANRVLAVTRRTFDTIDATTFKYIFKGLVRPHLEYAAPIWSPHDDNLKEQIENVQRRATKLIPAISHLDYPDRLKALKMPTLAYRRVRGDMIQVYKLLNGKYDTSLPQFLTLSHNKEKGLNRHNLDLYLHNCSKDIKKYCFASRVHRLWNSLPEELVNAEKVFEFEVGLDKFWENQPLLYDDFLADIITKNRG